jgi:hypothetical protein
MTVVKDIFPASRNAALARLAQFIPGAGQNYAFGRNTDPGPEQPSAVSKLSPYLRYRMITEQEVVQAVLEQHSLAAAEKFIQEILWRTYWKGWLEMRPSVWTQFQEERDRQRDSFPNARAIRNAEAGRPALKALTIGHASLSKRAICTITRECGLPQSGFLRCACHGRWARTFSCATWLTPTQRATHCHGAGSPACKPVAKPTSRQRTISRDTPVGDLHQKGWQRSL